ncbi:hypothetical protein SAY87_015032 [Trapa incisa]|uniref:Pentatricopeptide repeat-containing protein n=1 Tax=Trapa incisa TaxID=236973 RepID=A0AAN7JDS3_9MYRT|nr:hypothetical protein SAY87_015032 [Trapa incisa]
MAAVQFLNSSALLQVSGYCTSRQSLSFDLVDGGRVSSCTGFNSCDAYPSTSLQLRHCLSWTSPLARVLYRDHVAVAYDYSSYSRKIKDYLHEGLFEDAVRIYIQMLECDVPVEGFQLFPSLIKAFGKVYDVRTGRQIHGHVLKLGVVDDIAVVNSILGMYWNCSSADALDLFERMHVRDSVTWNTMISGLRFIGDYLSSLTVFRQMLQEAPYVQPDRIASLSVLSACASVCDLIRGREIHGYAEKSGMVHDQFLATSLVDMYMKCGDIKSAKNVFGRACMNNSVKENPVIWNAMIFGYASNGYMYEALTLLVEMLDAGIKPDTSTAVASLVSCSYSLGIVGLQIHGLVYILGLQSDMRVQTALIDMYFRCGNDEAGAKIFRTSESTSIVMWGTLISGYMQIGFPNEALYLCNKFVRVFGFADSVVILVALRACASLKLKRTGTGFHSLAIKIGCAFDVFTGSALVDLYAKCGDIKSGETVFQRLSARDLITWNSLIAGYAQHECSGEALEAFEDMQLEGIKPNTVTMASILSVCAQLSAMILCKEIHCYIIRQGLQSNILVSNALVTAYAKCGCISTALAVFNNMGEKNIISWNSILLSLGIHGCAEETFMLFEKMKEMGVVPDHTTFTAMLSACSHSGHVDKGWKYFRSLMDEYNLEPKLQQYTCMVDLLGRSGNLDQAYDLILSMPCNPDDKIWGSLLSSCKVYGNETLAKIVANHIFEINPDSIGYRVLLSNLYEDYEKWSEVDRIRSDIKDRGLHKRPGCSWIKVNNCVHVFTAGDCSHEEACGIYACLEILTAEITKNRSVESNVDFPTLDITYS